MTISCKEERMIIIECNKNNGCCGGKSNTACMGETCLASLHICPDNILDYCIDYSQFLGTNNSANVADTITTSSWQITLRSGSGSPALVQASDAIIGANSNITQIFIDSTAVNTGDQYVVKNEITTNDGRKVYASFLIIIDDCSCN